MKIVKDKLKIIITFAILFSAVLVLLLLIFFAGKKTYTVRFDLDGGTLISGSLEQHVTQGQNASPPVVVKDGAYLLSWSAPTQKITHDTEIKAIWEYETTSGIIYDVGEEQNYAEITGSYEYLNGEVYLGAYYGEKKILGIKDGAFADRVGITKVYLLDGLIYIGEGAFSGCTALTEIEIPETVTHIASGAFLGCEALETLLLNEGLLSIGAGAFAGCTSLKEIVLPESLVSIDADAFLGCEDLVIRVPFSEDEVPEGWADAFWGDATVIWGEVEHTDGTDTEAEEA